MSTYIEYLFGKSFYLLLVSLYAYYPILEYILACLDLPCKHGYSFIKMKKPEHPKGRASSMGSLCT